jgi:hypothetical protein
MDSDEERRQRRLNDADDSWRRTRSIKFDGVSAGETDDSLGRCRPAEARAIIDAIKLLPSNMHDDVWHAAEEKGHKRAVIEEEAKNAKSTNIIRKNAADAAQQLREWEIEIPDKGAFRRRLMQTLIDLRKKKDVVVEKEGFRRALDQNASVSQPLEHVAYLCGSDEEEEGEVEEEWAEGDGPWLIKDMRDADWNSERFIPCANQIFKSTSM